MIFHARPSCLMFYTWPHRRFRLDGSNLPASSWPSFVKKKIMQRFRGLKVVKIGTFMKYLSCFSLFYIRYFDFYFILHIALWFWRISIDHYQKLLSLPLKLWARKHVNCYLLLTYMLTCSLFCLNWRHCTRKTTENNGFPSGVQSSWAMEDLLVLH